MAGRRVFLDVGGHTGESLSVAMEPRWAFDRIWSFEPTSSGVARLRAISDERVTVVPAGLWSADVEMDLYDPGTLHGSVDATAAKSGEVERCRFIDAGTWMADHIRTEDHVWLKLNVEASEVEVLARLLDTGEISKVDHLAVHFDVEKVGRAHEAKAMRERLDRADVRWREAKQVMFGRTDSAKVQTWLIWTNGDQWAFRFRRLVHQARRRLFAARRWWRRHG